MKNITLFLMTLILAGPTYAKWGANCTSNGGTIVKANEYGTKDGVNLDKGGLCNDPNDPNLTNNCNGMEFCRSNKDMNWWSAFTWCESVGGKLANIQIMCPNTNLIEQTDCPNFKGVLSGGSWSTTGSSDSSVWTLGWQGYKFDGRRKRNAVSARAFCEEN